MFDFLLLDLNWRLPLPCPHPHIGDPFAEAFATWVQRCRLSEYLRMDLLELCPDEHSLARVPLKGMLAASPGADTSHHGREYGCYLWHGTCFSHLPSILSCGTLLRCSTPTRGCHAIWAAEGRGRALHYSPPVTLNGIPVQCALLLQASRVKNSHFQTTDKQYMLRECWHTLLYIYICKHSGVSTYRATHSLDRFMPRFGWSPSYSNWGPLPQPWNVVTNTGGGGASLSESIPEIPMP
jgi:hypothetical protein